MTICYNAHLGRRAETHLATIAATGNLIVFHVSPAIIGPSESSGDEFSYGRGGGVGRGLGLGVALGEVKVHVNSSTCVRQQSTAQG
jgi:hypothetical protein